MPLILMKTQAELDDATAAYRQAIRLRPDLTLNLDGNLHPIARFRYTQEASG